MSSSRPPSPVDHLAAIVASSDDAIVSKTVEGIITSWNRAAERMFGYRAEEAVGQSIRLIIPKERWSEEDEVLRQIRRGETVDHFETVRQRRDGSMIDISLTVSPIRDATGTITGASKIARDITERRRIEAELAATAEQLAQLLAEAQAANRSKDEFLAILSHELRTPLNAILGWSEVLLARPQDPELLQRGLEAISRNVKAQTRLIEDLLDVSRIVSGKMRLDAHVLELAPIVAAAVEAIRPTAEAKGIQVRGVFDPAGVVVGDADRLQQVLWNLLSNAVKFTRKGGHVQVTLVRVNSHLEIVVSDDGIGISPEFLPHIFERFRQADSSSRRMAGGLGLGLAIARDLIELHGGTLEAHSAGEGKGTTFIIRLPLSLAHPLAVGTPGAYSPSLAKLPSPDLGGLRVLVVDDDPASCDLAENILAPLGAEVLVAGSAREGFEALVRWRPDVLLADIEMPGENGYGLIQKVRSLPLAEGGGTPAAAVTAFARRDDRWRVLGAGFQLHLEKPIEPIGLAVAVANLAGRRSDPSGSAP
jgi:PAS domain S-box-containing protein